MKYLGKTKQNPYKYKGSGKYWLRHLKKYGNYVETKILFQSENNEDIKKMGLLYSNLWNITVSKNWANLVEESGTGGDTSNSPKYIKAKKEKQFSKHTKNKTYEEMYGVEKAKLLKHSRSESNKNRGNRSQETKNKISETRKKLFKEGKLFPTNKKPTS